MHTSSALRPRLLQSTRDLRANLAAVAATSVVALALGALPVPQSARAAEFQPPKRKPGLWEITTTPDTAKSKPIVAKQCVDAATDNLFRKFGEGSKQISCSKNEIRREGDAIVVETECKMGPSVTKSRAELTGDFQSSYSGESHVTYDPPLMGIARATIKTSAKWLGPCEKGQKPGDMVLPSGETVNIKDIPTGN